MTTFQPTVSLGRWVSSTSSAALSALKKIRDSTADYLENSKEIRSYTKEFIQSGTEWQDGVRECMLNILKICRFANPEKIYADNQKLFEKTFTAMSYDFMENYELLEKLGDTIAKTVLTIILMDKYPKISPQTMSETTSHILSKKEQGRISKDLCWADNVRSGYVNVADGKVVYQCTTSVAEDIFESIFGAICQVGNSIAFGAGMTYANNLMRYLVKQEHIVLRETVDLPPITVTEQLFKAKNWGDPILRITEKPGLSGRPSYLAVLKLSAKAERDIRINGPGINYCTEDIVIQIERHMAGEEPAPEYVVDPALIEMTRKFFGSAEGYSHQDAKKNAYENGFNTLKAHGIITNIDSVRGYNQFISHRLFASFRRAYVMAREKGYKNLYISKISDNIDAIKYDYSCQLFGCKANKEIDLLMAFVIPIVDISSKPPIDIIREYVYKTYADSEEIDQGTTWDKLYYASSE